MIRFFNILALLHLCLNLSVSSTHEIKHQIKVIHKGISVTEPTECLLVEVQDKQSEPLEFYMDVESVVCGDNQCRIDLVRIYWDKFGRYDRLQLPDGVALEKAGGELFSASDYDKLETILKDENSSLQEVYKNEIVGTIGGEGIDAMTGATILVEKSAYVQGAVWTCYSLWHWAHGNAKQIIRNITGDAYSISELQHLLEQNKNPHFAIEQLIRRKDFSKSTNEFLLKAIEVNSTLLKPSLPYWETAPDLVYLSAMQQLIPNANKTNRLLCFNTILQASQNLPPNFFNELNLPLQELTYQEIDLFLRILVKKNGITQQGLSTLFSLLNSTDFLIARRVFWFLKEQELSKSQEHQIHKFHEKWKDKL